MLDFLGWFSNFICFSPIFMYFFVLLFRRFPQLCLLTFYWTLNYGCCTFEFQELHLVLWFMTLLECPVPISRKRCCGSCLRGFILIVVFVSCDISFCTMHCFIRIPVFFFLVWYSSHRWLSSNVWRWLAIRSHLGDVLKCGWVTWEACVRLLTGQLPRKEIR